MKLIFLIIAIFILHFFTPFWWWILALPLAYGLFMAKSGWSAFLSGLLASGAVWGMMCIYTAQNGGDLILGRVNTLLSFPADAFEILLATTVTAMLCGAFGALTGYLFRDLFRKTATS